MVLIHKTFHKHLFLLTAILWFNFCLQLSVTLKEWDIPFEQLKLMDKIGTGRFGTVYK